MPAARAFQKTFNACSGRLFLFVIFGSGESGGVGKVVEQGVFGPVVLAGVLAVDHHFAIGKDFYQHIVSLWAYNLIIYGQEIL